MKRLSVECRPCFTLRETRFGPVAVIWSIRGGVPAILRVVISHPHAPADRIVRAAFPGTRSSSCPEIESVADLVAASMAGDDVRLPLDLAGMDLCSEFQQQVLGAVHAIPRGSVSTYRRIAAQLGHPQTARAVGTALAANPFPILVPCHRVIRSDGTLGGYGGGLPMKRALLESEGVRFDPAGRVLPGQYRY